MTNIKARVKGDNTDVASFSVNKTAASNQEQFSPGKVRTVAPGDGSKYNVGNLVRVGANTEDTSQVGNPLQSYQRRVLPAVANPDQGNDRSSLNRVAKKATDKEVL